MLVRRAHDRLHVGGGCRDRPRRRAAGRRPASCSRHSAGLSRRERLTPSAPSAPAIAAKNASKFAESWKPRCVAGRCDRSPDAVGIGVGDRRRSGRRVLRQCRAARAAGSRRGRSTKAGGIGPPVAQSSNSTVCTIGAEREARDLHHAAEIAGRDDVRIDAVDMRGFALRRAPWRCRAAADCRCRRSRSRNAPPVRRAPRNRRARVTAVADANPPEERHVRHRRKGGQGAQDRRFEHPRRDRDRGRRRTLRGASGARRRPTPILLLPSSRR